MSEIRVTTPIAAGDRVNDVLARSDALIDVFMRHSAHFGKLRNRGMRKIMARLVTVEDAARIANVPVAALLRDLNAALGLEAGAVEPVSPPPSHVAHQPSGARMMDVDVRDDLRNGREPLGRIMSALRSLGPQDVLHVRAIFLPAPLLTLLAARGFANESHASAPDDWSVWFWRADGEQVAAAPAVGDTPLPTEARANTVWLDVRGLEPPEPLMRTLTALESLPSGHDLVHVNTRVPQLLLPMLAERGFAFDLDESSADRVLLTIRRAH